MGNAERLTGLDASFLAFEKGGAHMHVGSVMIFEGPAPRPLLAIPGLPRITGLICYEAVFPAAVIQGADRPGLLVNLTNDGWFGVTTGPYQHFHQARIRAVEVNSIAATHHHAVRNRLPRETKPWRKVCRIRRNQR